MPRNLESQEQHEQRPQQHATLPFLFTPVQQPRAKADNPHAKASTHVPEAVNALKAQFGGGVLGEYSYAGETTVFVEKARIVEVLTFLKNDLGFVYLTDLGGIDRFTEDDRYEVFYHVCNVKERKRIRIKVRVDEEDETVPTVTGVYKAAMWHERELYDMMGIRAIGHPDPRRMLLPEDFDHFPQRKEFPTLGIPGSLPLPPQTPDGPLTHDPFARAHGQLPEKK